MDTETNELVVILLGLIILFGVAGGIAFANRMIVLGLLALICSVTIGNILVQGIGIEIEKARTQTSCQEVPPTPQTPEKPIPKGGVGGKQHGQAMVFIGNDVDAQPSAADYAAYDRKVAEYNKAHPRNGLYGE